LPADDRIGRQRYLLILARLHDLEGELDAGDAALDEWLSLSQRGEEANLQGYHYLRFRLAAKRGHRSALRHLAIALERARSKKRYPAVGEMLLERSLAFAKRTQWKTAISDSLDAASAFRSAGVRDGEVQALLLAAEMNFEAEKHGAAASVVNRLLEIADQCQHSAAIGSALQIRTRALQALGRIREAGETNQRFREHVSDKPQALVIADAQDAMLLAQAGDLDAARETFSRAVQAAARARCDSAIVASIKIHLAEILTELTRFGEALHFLREALPEAERLPERARSDLYRLLAYNDAVAPVALQLQELLSHEKPLVVARTSESKDLREAHSSIVRPVLEWSSSFPKAAAGILDFWGRGNFTRYLLNNRGFPESWHVTVEATTVEQAEYWTRILSPIVDVLTILWKGPINDVGLCLVPIHAAYDGPGGWGYSVAAGSALRSETDPGDWDWAPAMSAATLLPDRAANFLFGKARRLFEAGRLFLFPAVNVGCVGKGHSPLERAFNTLANATPWLSAVGRNEQAEALGTFPLPYFPKIPLDELARVIEGEEDSCFELRRALRNWSVSVGSGALDSAHASRELREEVESGLRSVERRFADLTRRLEWAQSAGEIRSYVLKPGAWGVDPTNLATAALAGLFDELHASPWYAFFRLSAAGYRWDITRNSPTANRPVRAIVNPRQIRHWIVPPTGGWTSPIISLA
jgi:tetratricopeptide (TPR) repeat protein